MSYAQDYANAASQLIEQSGQARAQGILGAGQAWGQALNQVGQTVAALPQQITQQKQAALQGQLTAAQVADAQAQAAERQRETQRAQGYAQALAVTTPKYITPNPSGGYTTDDQGLAEDLTQQGWGPEAQSYLKDASDLRAKVATIQTAQDAHAAAVQAHNDTMADRVADLVDGLQTPTDAVNALHAAVMAGALDPQTAATLAGKITASPNGWAQTKAALLAASPSRQKEAATLRAKLTTPQIVTTAPGAVTNVITPGQLQRGQAPGGGAPSPGVSPSSTGVVPVAQGAHTLESKPVMLNGQQAMVNFDPLTGKYTLPNGADVSAAVKPQPTQAIVNIQQAGAVGASPSATGTPNPTTGRNDAYLAQLPQNMQGTVKLIADGKMAVPTGTALRAPYWANVIDAVTKYDPTFDAGAANARFKTRQDFTSGTTAKSINALNTVVGHLDSLSTAAAGLNNSDFTGYNAVANWVGDLTGKPAPKTYQATVSAVADELTRVWRQAGGSESDIQQRLQSLSSSSSPAQFKAVIGQIGNLIESKLTSFQNQYQQGMGTNDISVITPATQATLDRLRGATSGTTLMRNPKDGQIYPVPNDRVAAAKAAGATIIGGGGG